jgi:hypothetical protein
LVVEFRGAGGREARVEVIFKHDPAYRQRRAPWGDNPIVVVLDVFDTCARARSIMETVCPRREV